MEARFFDARTALVVAFKFRWRATLVFSAFVGLSLAVTIMMRTEYAASASVLVKMGRELIYRPEVGTAQGAVPAVDRDETMASIITLMESPAIARQVIGAIGLTRLYPDMAPGAKPATGPATWIAATIGWVSHLAGGPTEDPMTTATRRFDRKLKVGVIKRTGIISVGFSSPDPEIAALGANLVVSVFQKQAGNLYDSANLPAMQELVDRERAGLDGAQAALSTYRQKYGVYAIDDQIGALLKQKTDIDSNLKSDATHVAELQILVATLAAQRDTVPQRVVVFTDTIRNRVVDDTEAQLLALRIQERQLSTRFSVNYPPLVELRNQIALAQQSLRSASAESGVLPRTGMNETYTTLQQNLLQRQAELDSFTGRQLAMKAQLTAIDHSLAELSSRQRILLALQQDVALRTDAVKASYDRLAEARAVDGLNGQKPSSFSLYQEAVPPDPANPSKPQPVLYVMIGAIVGLFAAITTIFLSYVTSGSFLTPELASARLNLPVLGVVDYRRGLGNLRGVAVLEGATRPVGSGAPGALSRR